MKSTVNENVVQSLPIHLIISKRPINNHPDLDGNHFASLWLLKNNMKNTVIIAMSV